MRSLLVTLLLFAAASAAVADPIALPRQDLWGNPVCDHHPKPATGVPYSSTMLDSNVTAAKDYQSHDLQAMRTTSAVAYSYAKAHCFALRLGNADLSFDEGDYKEAFAYYRDGFFLPRGGTINPMYADAGATGPFKTGMFAAAEADDATAERGFRAAIEKSRDFQEAHLMLGDLLYATGRKAEARREWLAVLGSYGPAIPEKEYFGPDPPWMSALRMYEVHR